MFVRSSQISAALGIAAILLTPLLGVPPSVLGIPIWYQNSFLWGLLATVCVGIFAVIAYSLRYFQRTGIPGAHYIECYSISGDFCSEPGVHPEC